MQNTAEPLVRSFEVLRFSIIDRCNFACLYCVDSAHQVAARHVPAETLLGYVESLIKAVGLKTVRITGGEPTIHPELIQIISGLKSMGIDDIRMTTNGHRLKSILHDAMNAGLRSVNISLDAMSAEIFSRMSRGHRVAPVLEGIKEAAQAGLPTKLNSVIMRGVNETEIVPLLDFARQADVIVRYLEVMNMGPLYEAGVSEIVTEEEIVSIIGSVRGECAAIRREDHSTTNYFTTPDEQTFGVISNHSHPFCSDCNRLRLDSQGNIYGCLSSSEKENINQTSNLDQLLSRALARKKLRFGGSSLIMKDVGG